MRWMLPCQTWRLHWREGRRPTHWYENTTILQYIFMLTTAILTSLSEYFFSSNNFGFGPLFLCSDEVSFHLLYLTVAVTYMQ